MSLCKLSLHKIHDDFQYKIHFQIIMHFFDNVYYLQCLFLENNIQTFTTLEVVQR